MPVQPFADSISGTYCFSQGDGARSITRRSDSQCSCTNINSHNQIVPGTCFILFALFPTLLYDQRATYSSDEKGRLFAWTTEVPQAFDRVKETIANSVTLELFDPDIPVVVATDASAYDMLLQCRT